MNASTVITLKGVLALLLSILMGGCSVEIPDFNKVEFPCLEDSDCADDYECARSGEADGICIESGTTPVPVDCEAHCTGRRISRDYGDDGWWSGHLCMR